MTEAEQKVSVIIESYRKNFTKWSGKWEDFLNPEKRPAAARSLINHAFYTIDPSNLNFAERLALQLWILAEGCKKAIWTLLSFARISMGCIQILAGRKPAMESAEEEFVAYCLAQGDRFMSAKVDPDLSNIIFQNFIRSNRLMNCRSGRMADVPTALGFAFVENAEKAASLEDAIHKL